jgi:glucose/arabinose dehydrogenase
MPARGVARPNDRCGADLIARALLSSLSRRCSAGPGALLLLALACSGDSPTEPPAVGRLFVPVRGLPAGANAAVQVAGPRGFTQSVTAPAILTQLRAGAYSITAAPVTTGSGRFIPVPASQSVAVGSEQQAAARAVTYTVASALVTVRLRGLPAGARPDATLSGPAGFTRTLTDTSTTLLLDPGGYTLSVADVSVAGATYRSDPATQTFTVAASTDVRLHAATYGAGDATLDVTVSGLPPGTDAAISVTDAANLVRRVDRTHRLQHLAPGTYTVVAATVGAALTTFVPVIPVRTVQLSAGGTAAVAVSYAAAPLRLGLQPVVEGLTAPVFVAAPHGDDRLFIVERHGRVLLYRNGGLLETPFLDIRSRVNFEGERGMFSIAFDPRFAANGLFYVYYVNSAGDVVLERFTSAPGSDVAGASQGLIVSVRHGGPEHHGGLVDFGPDELLYLALGDGRCCGDPDNNAQNVATLLGKVLRLDVSVTPFANPMGNPFAEGNGGRPEIWAWGLRSPWRFAFDDSSRTLIVSDVGQDAREEVNVVPLDAPGINYGWPTMEGIACYRPLNNCNPVGLTLPAVDYHHAEGCSVIGGYVYRGTAIPELRGHYIYSDFCRGWLRSFRIAGVTAVDRREWSGVAITRPVSFGRDGRGELYMIAGTRVWRIVRL